MASLFISYSRKDIEVARRLTEAFNGQGLDFWIDWEGIPPTVDWWKEIEKGIEEADIFLFLISPDSTKSQVCKQELEHAAKNGKRLIPVVVSDIKPEESPTELGLLNWIFIRKNDDFKLGFSKLITAIKTDYEWAQTHRQLQVKALEWERSNHENSFLLRGKELQNAEFQLATNTSKEPYPTDLQREYVLKSRQATDKQRRLTTGIAIAGIVALVGLAIFGFVQAGQATRQANIALTAQALAEERTKIARAGQLAAQAVAAYDKDFQLSLLLSIEAFQSKDTFQTRSVLLDNTQANSQLRIFLNGPRDPVSSVAFRADGKTPISSVAFSPDGRLLASGSDDNTIILWDVKTGLPIGQPLTGHTSWVTSVAFSPDGKVLVSASYDKTIILWNVETGQPVAPPMMGNSDIVNSVAFSPDGRTLVSGSCGGTDDIGSCNQGEIIFWDVETFQPIGQPLLGHTSSVDSVAFSPDGKILASGSEADIILWDADTHKPIGLPLVFTDIYGNSSIAFSPDGKILAAGHWFSITLWNVETQQVIGQPLSGHRDLLSSVAFAPDGKMLASGSVDRTIILWDLETGQPIGKPLSGHSGGVNSVSFSPDGKALASGSDDNTVILWDLETQQPLGQSIKGHSDTVNGVAFSPDGMTLASASNDQTIILWDMKTRQPIGQPLTGHHDAVTSVAFSPDGKTLASGSNDSTIILWDVETGQPSGHPLAGHTDIVKSIAFSPDGRMLASGSDDGTIILWNAETHLQIGQPLIGHSSVVNSVAFSPDGKTLASGSWDDTIILWNVETHLPIGQPLTGHTDFINSVAFSPDGKMLASGSWDFTIILWDVQTSQPIGQPFPGHQHWVDSVAFSPDGRTLSSGGNDGALFLWDVESRQPIGQLSTDGFAISSVAFSPDGKSLISGGVNNNLTLWDLDPHSWLEKSCQRVRRNFTATEWERFFPGEEYHATCLQFPLVTVSREAATAQPTPTAQAQIQIPPIKDFRSSRPTTILVLFLCFCCIGAFIIVCIGLYYLYKSKKNSKGRIKDIHQK